MFDSSSPRRNEGAFSNVFAFFHPRGGGRGAPTRCTVALLIVVRRRYRSPAAGCVRPGPRRVLSSTQQQAMAVPFPSSASAAKPAVTAREEVAASRLRLALAVVAMAIGCVLFVKFMVVGKGRHRGFDTLYILAEALHFIGIGFLGWRLKREGTCEGLSLRTQEITAVFLGIRLCCSVSLEQDIHCLLDFLTLVATLWVIATMRSRRLAVTYDAALDWKVSSTITIIYVPCFLLALLVHPQLVPGPWININNLAFVGWAFVCYLEAVSVIPQLAMMRSIASKLGYLARGSTAHYVFAIACARFLAVAHWLLEYDQVWAMYGPIYLAASSSHR